MSYPKKIMHSLNLTILNHCLSTCMWTKDWWSKLMLNNVFFGVFHLKNFPTFFPLLSCIMDFGRLTKEVKELDYVWSGLCIDYSLGWKYWHKIFWREWRGEFHFNIGVWKLDSAFQNSWKAKAEIPEESLKNYGIPKAWGVEQLGVLRAR